MQYLLRKNNKLNKSYSIFQIDLQYPVIYTDAMFLTRNLC